MSQDIILMPYVCLDGEWTIDMDGLIGIWNKLCEQELDDIVFWDGRVASTREWVEFCQSRHLTFFIIDREVVGFAWLHPIMGNYAFAHFCHFREIWGERTVEIGHLMVHSWFDIPRGDGVPLLDLLVGVIPKFNDSAQRYVETLGWTHLGAIPEMMASKDGIREDAMIFYRSRNPDGW